MLSHHHKCVFIHVPKTAGQSIEHVFLDHIGLTWDTRAPLLLRPNDRPELGPPRLAHLRARDYVACRYMPQDMFDAYFKFAFVRNPWSRMVSLYKYWGVEGKRDFKTFLLQDFNNRLLQEHYWFACPQTDFLYDEAGKRLVNFVGKFENLGPDFRYVCERLGLPQVALPHVNATSPGQASAASTYRDYYDAETVDYIAQVYASDVQAFGYSFD